MTSPDAFDAPKQSSSQEDLIDALFAEGFDPSALPELLERLAPEERRRAERLLALVERLDAYEASTDHSDTLVAATLARVAQTEAQRGDRMRLDPQRAEEAGARRRFRLADVVAVASVAILAISVLVPLANWAGGRSLEARCANNLRLLSAGITNYLNDHRAMPMTAGIVPSQLADWAGLRHSDNLRPLVERHYCDASCMHCPGDAEKEGRYAYRVPNDRADASRPDARPRAILIGDRNPLVDLRRHGAPIVRVTLNSNCHEGRGQNVLRADGSILFLYEPCLAGAEGAEADNIWLPFGNAADALFGRPGPVIDTFMLH